MAERDDDNRDDATDDTTQTEVSESELLEHGPEKAMKHQDHPHRDAEVSSDTYTRARKTSRKKR